MANDGFTFDISDLQTLAGNVLDGMEKTGELMEQIGEHMHSEIMMAMDSEETFDGEQWPDGNRGGQALAATGKLHGAITYAATKSSVSVGVGKAAEDRYPHVHNEGMVIKPKNKQALKVPMPDGSFRMVKQVTIPKREFIPDFGASPRARDEIRELCEEYMKEIMEL